MKVQFLLLVFIPIMCVSQQFEEVETVIKNFYYSSIDISDMDDDGDLDIVHNGALDVDSDGGADQTQNEVYRNDESSFSLATNLGESSTHLGDIRFIDFDNDGLKDIVSTGLSYNDIVNYKQYRFKNTGDGFELVDDFDGKIYGSLEIFDFNHDGRQDYALNGTQYIDEIGFIYELDLYQNTLEGFEKNQGWLAGTQNGNFKVLDINNDNLLDLVVNGYNADMEPLFYIYKNNEGVLELAQEINPVTSGKIVYADFDADGYLDMVACGQDVEYEPFLGVYFNDGTGNFSETIVEGEGLDMSSVDVGDFNNDGYYDLIVNGDDADYVAHTKIFVFDPTNKTFSLAENTGLYDLGGQGNIKAFDYNGDHHLDVLISGFDWSDDDMPSLTKLFKSTTTEQNEKPQAPTELILEQDGNRLNFSWSGATDDKTPEQALQYEIKVGSTSGAQDIAKYVVTTPNWFLDFEEIPQNIYWSVRSMDASKTFSDSSVENQMNLVDSQLAQEIKLYPNPATDLVYIQSQHPVNKVEVYSLEGKKLNVKYDLNSLNVSSLSKGVYLIKLYVENAVQTKKLMIE